jgi:hypothetical protein
VKCDKVGGLAPVSRISMVKVMEEGTAIQSLQSAKQQGNAVQIPEFHIR